MRPSSNGRSATSSQSDENITPAEEKKIRMEARKQERIQAIRADEKIKMLNEAFENMLLETSKRDIKIWDDCQKAGPSCTETPRGRMHKRIADDARKALSELHQPPTR